MVRNLGLIQRNTRRSKTDRNSRNNSTDNKHSTVLRGTLEDRANDPNPSRDHDSGPPSQNVCQLGDQESSKEGTCRHGCDNGPLSVGPWMAERPFVCFILEARCTVSGGGVRRSRRRNTDAQDTGHGRDVQTEQTASDTCERSYKVLGQGQTAVQWGHSRNARTGLDAIRVLYWKRRNKHGKDMISL